MKQTKSFFKISILSLTLVSFSAGHAQDLIGTGTRGKDGKDGKSYSTRPRSNPRSDVTSRSRCETTPGRKGTDGTDASRGGRGSDFNLKVSDVGEILVMGTMTSYRSGFPEAHEIYEQTSLSRVLQISSRGGKGGTAGRGGDGEGAEEGQDSQDHANNERENGGDGCDAGLPGSAGNAGTPGNGGDAGNIKIKLSSDDTHLLLAISTDARGGDAGDRNRGGEAGSQAAGGKGAKGFYEDRSGQYPTGRKIDEPGCTSREAGHYGTGRYEDAPGCDKSPDCEWVNTTASGIEKMEYKCGAPKTCTQVEVTEYRSAINCRQVDETRYKEVIVRTEKGSQGQSSPAAGGGKDSPDSARAGTSGSVIYEVVDAQTGKLSRYSPSEIVDLSMLEYDMVDEDRNGIFEPGETVKLMNLKIRNTSQMDYTFTKAQTLVFLRTQDWLIADPQTITIPHIKAGQTLVIKDPGLRFTIRSNSFRADAQLPAWEQTIVPHNRITRIERQFDRLSLAKSFYITFPVRLNSFEVPSSIEAGSSVPISWSIENLSSATIPDLGAYARSVRTSLDLNSEHLSGDQISIELSGADSKTMATNLVTMISGLKSHEIRVIKGTLSARSDIEPYSTGELTLALDLNRFNSDERVVVQKTNASILITRVYKANTKDDLLLVLTDSNKTIYRTWSALLQKLGLNGNIWDLSIDGGFSFFDSLRTGGTISSDFKNKSVVLPKIISHGAVNRLLSDAHKDLHKAANKNNNSLYLVGYDSQEFQALLAKNLDTQNRVAHSNVDAFLQSLESNFDRREQTVHEISVGESYFFARKPRADKLYETKTNIEKSLKKKFPEQSFIVSVDFNPQSNGSFIKASYFLGKVYVRAGISYEDAKLVLLPTKLDPYSPQFITSTDNVRSLCLSLNPQARLKALNALSKTSQDSDMFKTLLDCVQFDIYQEWMRSDKNTARTKYYLDFIKSIYSKLNGEKQKKVEGFATMLLVMSRSGLQDNHQATATLDSFMSVFNKAQIEKIEKAVKEVQKKIQNVSNTTKESALLTTRRMVLKSINPRAHTTGVNAYDLAK